MDIRNLNTFIQAAELGSFSQAGEKLGYSQPTVSVQIRQLEEELGARLFDRIGHAVRLTDRGRELLRYAQEICRLSQEMSGQEAETGAEIRLATADSLCGPLLLDSLEGLRQACPHISLKLTTAGTDGLFRMLDRNEADLVCTLDSHIYDHSYVIAGERKVGVHLVAAPGHPLAQGGAVTRERLLEQELLLTEKGMSYRRLLDQWMAQASMAVEPRLETGRADLISTLVERGRGVSFLPDYVTEAAVRRGTLVRLEAEDFQPELWKQLLYHRGKWVSRAMQAVIDHLAPAFDTSS